jgi:hypothetical protein
MSDDQLKNETLYWLEKLDNTFGNNLGKIIIKTGGEENTQTSAH